MQTTVCTGPGSALHTAKCTPHRRMLRYPTQTRILQTGAAVPAVCQQSDNIIITDHFTANQEIQTSTHITHITRCLRDMSHDVGSNIRAVIPSNLQGISLVCSTTGISIVFQRLVTRCRFSRKSLTYVRGFLTITCFYGYLLRIVCSWF